MYLDDVDFSILKSKTMVSVINKDNEELVFTTDTGEEYILRHQQDWCESVTIDDICGDLNDLVGHPILMAEEVISEENPEGVDIDYQESFTWTFYKLATIQGYVTIRWYGESNGYYSESVYLVRTVWFWDIDYD